ncbi:putative RNA-directed DNA polymerase from transposon X-element [Trichonephila clavipes]|nr:putative RNA-directed DNA polymerase from transposon X-element [Trichonephila clavipes]
MSWLLYQLVYNPACLVVPGGAWMGSCIAVRGALTRPLLVADSRTSPAKLVLRKSKGILLLLSKSKNFKISQNKKNVQNASFKTPNPPSPTHLNIEQISLNTRFLIVSLPNNLSIKSPFAIQKALIGIGGEPKSVKRLRSGDLLIETTSALQTKSFLLAKSFLNGPVTVFPHKKPEFLLIVPQLTQTYAQAARPSTISTATQTDPTLSNIICPPLQCLTPISSKNSLPGTSSSVSTFPTTSSSTQDNLLPSPSGILPTIQVESLLQIPIPTTTTTTSLAIT